MDFTSEWVPVHTCEQLDEAQEMALVLAALDIDYWLVRGIRGGADGFTLLAPAPSVEPARQHLAEYQQERRAWPPPQRAPMRLDIHLQDVMGLWLVLPGVFLCQQYACLGRNWLAAGFAHAELICAGQWWRTVTALTLHADGPHLYSNLLFATLFGFLLCHELGRGMAWLSVLVAGAAGNLLNACVQRSGHISVGASTAVFAAVGITMALQWQHHAGRGRLLRRAAPLIMGIAFLALLGTTGERTDVWAHVSGLLAGTACGAGLNRVRARLPDPRSPQVGLQMLTVLLLVGAWLLALR